MRRHKRLKLEGRNSGKNVCVIHSLSGLPKMFHFLNVIITAHFIPSAQQQAMKCSSFLPRKKKLEGSSSNTNVNNDVALLSVYVGR